MKIRNKYDFTNLSDFAFDWEVTSDGSIIQSGKLSFPDFKPASEKLVKIPIEKINPEPGTEYFLNMRVSKSQEWNLVPEDHVYATAQFKLPVEGPPAIAQPGELTVLQEKTVGNNLEVGGSGIKITFSLETGSLTSYNFRGKELIIKGPKPDFWRAPTDNDYGYGMDHLLGVWKKAGERCVVTKADINQVEPGKVVVVFRYDITGLEGEKIAGYSTVYTLFGSGDIIVSNSFEKISANIPEIPRMGMQMQLPAEYMNLKWLGRGPQENYADRKTAADVGLYESTVADQYVPYVRPQENGYKTDTRWLTLTDDSGNGILISGSPLFCFEALNNIHDDFESPGKLSQYRKDAKSANTHINNIKPRELINLNVDLAQMGVGGDNSWGAQIHPQYRLLERRYEYSFRIRPIVHDDDVVKLAKERL
jgi:beta-galactosidase